MEPQKQIYFSEIALNSSLGLGVAITFILGLIAAATAVQQCLDFAHHFVLCGLFILGKTIGRETKKSAKKDTYRHECPFGFGGNSL